MKKWRMLSLGLICALLLTGCGKTVQLSDNALALAEYPEMASYPDESKILNENNYDEWWADRWVQRNQTVDYTEAYDEFVFESAKVLLKDTLGENRVYSPANVYMALSMLSEITGGNTQRQILDVLGENNIEELREKMKAFWNAHYNNDGATTSILANSLWLDEGWSYQQKTLDILASDYYASSYRGEMGSEKFNKLLQNWLNDQTGGLLEEYTQTVELDPNAVIALASSILFRAKWTDEFSKERTEQLEFFMPGAKTPVLCDFMHQKGNSQYYWGEGFSAVAKSLEDSGSMWFFLPDEGLTPEDMLDNMAVWELLKDPTSWENSKFLIVNLAVPQFDISGEVDLIPALQEMGITDIFSEENADFSNLTDNDDGIVLGRAKHAARIAVDEEGCVAAAYTVMVACGAAMPPEEEVDFILNRPFLFVITGWDGLPLFVGVVNNPG